MHIQIAGKRWRIKFVPRSRRRGWFGQCTDPDAPHRTITIESGHKPITELDTIIHEALHASLAPLDEQYVRQTATDIARLLWRLGWRKTEA